MVKIGSSLNLPLLLLHPLLKSELNIFIEPVINCDILHNTCFKFVGRGVLKAGGSGDGKRSLLRLHIVSIIKDAIDI